MVNHLEHEKENFLMVMNDFLDSVVFEDNQLIGRPKMKINDILKCLTIMSYHSFSYRRCISDLVEMKNKGQIREVPTRSTICKYMSSPETKLKLKLLIQYSARCFIDKESCLIIDSTWFSKILPLSKIKKGDVDYTGEINIFSKTRKLHAGILKESKVICYATTSEGTRHDHNFFREIVKGTVNSFKIRTILADSAYCSKEHYNLCDKLRIENVFLDFKKNTRKSEGTNTLWKRQVKIYQENPEEWKESYRFRPLVESVFSIIKRKGKSYLRCRKSTSQDCEMLLNALWHNLTIIGRNFL